MKFRSLTEALVVFAIYGHYSLYVTLAAKVHGPVTELHISDKDVSPDGFSRSYVFASFYPLSFASFLSTGR
jgi:hypothetical protein